MVEPDVQVEGASEGCEHCEQGGKSVLFLTGECPLDCFYCPVSEKRDGEARAWINERPVYEDSDVLEEVASCRSSGTGITGGDPGTEPFEAARYVELLKREFGEGHHVHMYTGLPLTEEALEALEEAGLDELRLHPPEYRVDDELKRTAREASGRFDLGAEIPAIPGRGEEAVEAVEELGPMEFLNVNELEFSDTNASDMKHVGFETSETSAEGSLKTAREISGRVEVPTRICSSAFKDRVQLRNRYLKKADETATFEGVTEDGTLLQGRVEGDPEEISEVLREFGATEEDFEAEDGEVRCHPGLLEAAAEELKGADMECFLEERLPTHEKTLMELQPI